MNELELSYIAGLIDGDGSLSLIEQSSKRKRKNRLTDIVEEYEYVSYRPVIQIGNTYEPVLWWVKEQFNCGSISKSMPLRKRSMFYRWMTSGIRDVYRILEQLAPHLIEKQEIAILLKDFCRERLTGSIYEHSIKEVEIQKKIREKEFDTHSPNMKDLDNNVVAYVAGFFDAEGCISLSYQSGGKGYIQSRIIVSNTWKPILTWIKELFDYGKVNTRSTKPISVPNPVHEWRVNNIKEITLFLRILLPYLRIKR